MFTKHPLSESVRLGWDRTCQVFRFCWARHRCPPVFGTQNEAKTKRDGPLAGVIAEGSSERRHRSAATDELKHSWLTRSTRYSGYE